MAFCKEIVGKTNNEDCERPTNQDKEASLLACQFPSVRQRSRGRHACVLEVWFGVKTEERALSDMADD